MNQKVHNQIVSFIWSIADDVLRDVFVRGKYRDIILAIHRSKAFRCFACADKGESA
jgi:type I restriction-modification system DNA methylase subunit